MEPLQKLLELATSNGDLSHIAHRSARLRISLHADDAAIFLNPVQEEVTEVASPLNVFGSISGCVSMWQKVLVTQFAAMVLVYNFSCKTLTA
jgi:hypothetical protein